MQMTVPLRPGCNGCLNGHYVEHKASLTRPKTVDSNVYRASRKTGRIRSDSARKGSRFLAILPGSCWPAWSSWRADQTCSRMRNRKPANSAIAHWPGRGTTGVERTRAWLSDLAQSFGSIRSQRNNPHCPDGQKQHEVLSPHLEEPAA